MKYVILLICLFLSGCITDSLTPASVASVKLLQGDVKDLSFELKETVAVVEANALAISANVKAIELLAEHAELSKETAVHLNAATIDLEELTGLVERVAAANAKSIERANEDPSLLTEDMKSIGIGVLMSAVGLGGFQYRKKLLETKPV